MRIEVRLSTLVHVLHFGGLVMFVTRFLPISQYK